MHAKVHLHTIVIRRRPSLSAILAALGLLAAVPAAADAGKEQSVTVAASEYRFVPKKLSFQHGVAYRLHIDNRGKETHEFHAPEFFKALDLSDPSALNADRTEVVIPPGESRELRFVAKTPGRYPLTCSDHDWAGMTGSITIK